MGPAADAGVSRLGTDVRQEVEYLELKLVGKRE